MPGYSRTPLAKKLGIREGSLIGLVNAPKNFDKQLGQLPEDARFVTRINNLLDIIVFFADSQVRLKRDFSRLAAHIYPHGMLWVAWPKKSSGWVTDLNFANVQRIGLEAGLVDVKISAVDDIWSGLKFVYRLNDR